MLPAPASVLQHYAVVCNVVFIFVLSSVGLPDRVGIIYTEVKAVIIFEMICVKPGRVEVVEFCESKLALEQRPA